jgi:hypothetical protein
MKKDPEAKVPAGNRCPPLETRPSNVAAASCVRTGPVQLSPSID